MLIVEGVFPFFWPDQWRQTFRKITEFRTGQIRFFGFVALVLALILLAIAYA
ncbi:membrane protein [Pandoraea thiooxydans]|nr:membrane protein [Pandoraea thiooxydans]